MIDFKVKVIRWKPNTGEIHKCGEKTEYIENVAYRTFDVNVNGTMDGWFFSDVYAIDNEELLVYDNAEKHFKWVDVNERVPTFETDENGNLIYEAKVTLYQ